MARILAVVGALLLVGCKRDSVEQWRAQEYRHLRQSVTNESHVRQVRFLAGVPETAQLLTFEAVDGSEHNQIKKGRTWQLVVFQWNFESKDDWQRWYRVRESYYYDLDIPSPPFPLKLSALEIDGRGNRVIREEVWQLAAPLPVPRKVPSPSLQH